MKYVYTHVTTNIRIIKKQNHMLFAQLHILKSSDGIISNLVLCTFVIFNILIREFIEVYLKKVISLREIK